MKKILLIVMTAIVQNVIAQVKLEVTYNKTTNLVFPSAISSVDRGSQDVLVQKANGAEHILRVKADTRFFKETNLSVITVDGKLYSFIVNYAESPAVLNFTIESKSAIEQRVVSAGDGITSADATVVLKERNNIRSIKDGRSKVSLALRGLYVKDDVIFCKMKLGNESNINFDIDQFHFYIRDKKRSKRTASQEVAITLLSVSGDTGTIASKEKRNLVVAVPKFTIPDGKFLAIEIMERNGGRHLYLKAKNRHVMRARIIE